MELQNQIFVFIDVEIVVYSYYMHVLPCSSELTHHKTL